MHTPTIAVTGAAGFIGSHLCDALIEQGYHVVAIDNLSMGSLENLQSLTGHERFHFTKADVRDAETMRSLCGQAQAIVHLAAYKIPRYGNALDTLLINQQGAKNMLDVARETGCKVVLASTSDVYGKSPQLPFQEDGDLVIGPSTIRRWSYAVSKLYDEHLCLAYQEAYKFPVTVLRFFGSYGPRHHLSWWGGPQSVFISRILRDEEIEIHGDGTQTRSFTYVSDTVSGIVAAVESPEANGEILNLGSTFEISILKLAHLIKELTGTPGSLKLKLVPYNSISEGKYEDVMRRIPNIAKAHRLLGFTPQVGLEEGLLRTIAWQRSVTN
ncbi:MAG: SDR family NAD(P)-dependent oxidoreductase [Chloroflexales bacterium]|nr:SDR family NAD(P)-dependent oxidoreductase [Chloroflexales bacterium]